MKFLRMSRRVFNTPHAIEQGKLDEIMAYLGPHLAGSESTVPVIHVPAAEKTAALSFRSERGPTGTTTRLAVLEVNGTLLNRAGGMDALSGLASYEELRADFKQAVADSSVAGVMLRIDSCGGEVNGLEGLAETIYSARADKPIWCAVDDVAFSAAYWIASACERIFVSGTGMVGSVGVIAMHADQSGFDAKMGVKFTTIYAGAKKNDLNPHEPISDGAQKRIKADVNELYDKFAGAVARNRSMTTEAVKATEADVYRGQACIDAGLADQLGDFDFAMEALAAHVSDRKASTSAVKASAKAAIPDKKEGTRMENIKADAETVVDDPQSTEQEKPVEAPITAPPVTQEAAVAKTPVPKVLATFEQVAELCETQGLGIKEARELMSKGFSREEIAIDLLSRKRTAEQAAPVRSAVKSLPGGTAMDAIGKAAAAARAANPKLTPSQAMTAAMESNPDLYDQYLAANPAQTGNRQ